MPRRSVEKLLGGDRFIMVKDPGSRWSVRCRLGRPRHPAHGPGGRPLAPGGPIFPPEHKHNHASCVIETARATCWRPGTRGPAREGRTTS